MLRRNYTQIRRLLGVPKQKDTNQLSQLSREGYIKVRQELDKLKDPYRALNTGENRLVVKAYVFLFIFAYLMWMHFHSLDKRLRGSDGKLGKMDVPFFHDLMLDVPLWLARGVFLLAYKMWEPFSLKNYPTIHCLVKKGIIPLEISSNPVSLIQFLERNLKAEFTFLCGTHPRLGKNSSIYNFSKDRLSDRNNLRLIFGFLREDRKLEKAEQRTQESKEISYKF